MSFFILFFLLTFFSILEVQILFFLGKILSFWTVLGLILITGFLGAYLLKRQGLKQLKSLREMDIDLFVADSVLLLCSAVLLVCPGLITDFLGLLLLLPLIRYFLAKRIVSKISHLNQETYKKNDEIVIDIDE